jgi:hypothetical protein
MMSGSYPSDKRSLECGKQGKRKEANANVKQQPKFQVNRANLPACSISKTPSFTKSGSAQPVNLPVFVHSLSPQRSSISDPGFLLDEEEEPTLRDKDDAVRETTLNGFPVALTW